MKEVAIWEKLKLQIDNLESMYKQQQNGADVSNAAYWQLEMLNELLTSVGEGLGVTDELKDKFL